MQLFLHQCLVKALSVQFTPCSIYIGIHVPSISFLDVHKVGWRHDFTRNLQFCTLTLTTTAVPIARAPSSVEKKPSGCKSGIFQLSWRGAFCGSKNEKHNFELYLVLII